eukprot:GILI01012191.1.p1 GENE.GILI01012191.1~~GILI01012191.1.p1  ORF type:complete len:334 (+),score=33.34 GILI01012191.1:48-1049(+)
MPFSYRSLLLISCILLTGASAAEVNAKCQAAAKHLTKAGREMRKLYIPSIEHQEVGNTITGRPGCMVTQTGWWSYEFCFGDYIRQFHSENGVIKDEFFIGLTGAVMDEESHAHAFLTYQKKGSTQVSTRIKEEGLWEGINPAGPQYSLVCDPSLASSLLTNKKGGTVMFNHYDGGTKCENGKRRSATVFYLCDATKQPDPKVRMPIFFDIAETEPCTYQLFVRGDSMCSMMGLQVPPEPTEEKAEEPKAVKKSDPKYTGLRTLKEAAVEFYARKPKRQVEDSFQPVLNDEHLETVEEPPKLIETTEQQHPQNPFYEFGLDDPLFYEDSFIMSI